MKEKEIRIVDLLVLIVKNKHILFPITLLFMILFYLSIYFFVDEKFDSSSLIIPSEDNSMAGIAGLLGDLGGLPFNLGGGGTTTEMSMYNTIIYSRTTLEKVANKFNLVEVYGLDTTNIKYKKKLLERLADEITTEETDNGAYTITVRATSPELSAEINNHLIFLLNETIKNLKIKKSYENREFLSKRVEEVKQKLKNSEDSLVFYQQETKLLDADVQIQEILKNYTSLEFELLQKKIEESVLKKSIGENSPQHLQIKEFVNEYENKLDELRNVGIENSIILPINSLPKTAVNYIRLKREVEINNALLQFILPLYEQAKIEEKKDLPILQVIDYAVPPVEKSYPPRAVFTLLFGFGVFIILLSVLIFKENKDIIESEEFKYIKENLFKIKSQR